MAGPSSEKRKLEILVVLKKGAEADAALRQLKELGRVTQVASPHVVIITGEVDSIRALPGVESASDGAMLPSTIPDLNEQESQFVAAWNLRHSGTPEKRRKGEGMPWDAEGFQPPDPPHKLKN